MQNLHLLRLILSGLVKASCWHYVVLFSEVSIWVLNCFDELICD